MPRLERDFFAEFDRYKERLNVAVAAAVERDRQLAAVQAKRDAFDAMRQRVQAGDVVGYRQHIEWLCAEHRIGLTFGNPGPGATACANKTFRYIIVPPITSERDYATALHEIGHVASEACAGGLHQPTYVDNYRYVNCIRCEQLATERAMELSLRPFSRAMFAKLRGALLHYADVTEAPSAALRAAEQLASNLHFAEHRLRHLKRDHRERRQAAANRSVAIDREKTRRESL